MSNNELVRAQQEIARFAALVDTLKNQRDGATNALARAEGEIVAWKDAAGLLIGGDPGSVTPEMLRTYVAVLEEITRVAVRLVDNLDRDFHGAARAFDELKIALEPYRNIEEG